MQLQATSAGFQLFCQGVRQAGIPLTQKTEIHRHIVGALDHLGQIPWPRRTGGGIGASGRASTTTNHGGDAAHQGFFDLLRANKVNMGIDATRRQDRTFTSNHFRTRANNNIHSGLHIRVTGFADFYNTTVLDADVTFNHTPVIQYQRVGDHQIHRRFTVGWIIQHLALTHAITDHLTAAEFHFIAIDGEVFFYLNPQVGITQADFVANGRPEHLGISGAIHLDRDRMVVCTFSGRQLAHHFATKSVNFALASKLHQLDVATLAGFKPHGRSRSDIKMEAQGSIAVEAERRIGFSKMIVRTDLNGTVTGVFNPERQGFTANVQFNVTADGLYFTWNKHLCLPVVDRVCCLHYHAERGNESSLGIFSSGFHGSRGMPSGLTNRFVNRHQLGAIREGGFHLHFVNQFWHAVHHLLGAEQGFTVAHQFGNGFTVTGTFDNFHGDVSHGFGIVELQAAIQSSLGQQRGSEDQQLVFFSWQ